MPRLRVLGMLTPPDKEQAVLLRAMLLVYGLANDAEREHGGGAPYFDRLDSSIGQEPDILEAMALTVRRLYPRRVGLIVSGGFGQVWESWARSREPQLRPAVLLPGGLRHKPLPEYGSIRQYQFRMQGIHEFVFLDDSLYAGRTMDWVRTLVLMQGKTFGGAVVAYDGSNYKHRNVHALHRYFA